MSSCVHSWSWKRYAQKHERSRSIAPLGLLGILGLGRGPEPDRKTGTGPIDSSPLWGSGPNGGVIDLEFRAASSLLISMPRCVDCNRCKSMHRRARPAELAQVDSPLGLGVEGADVRPLYKVEGGEEEEQVVARGQFGCGVLAEPTSEGFERRPDVSFEGTRLCQQVTLPHSFAGRKPSRGLMAGSMSRCCWR